MRPDERLPAARVFSHLGVMVIVAAVMGVVVAGLAIPFAGAGRHRRARRLPHHGRPADRADGRAAGPEDAHRRRRRQHHRHLYDENRINVSLTQVSRTMVKSIVAIEDYRFYEHGALDLKGTLRALVTNQASGGVVQGGSSITQQMVKLTLVSQADTKAERGGRDRGELRPQDPRAALRDRLRGAVLQGLDPGALPQPRLLRRRRLRHPVRGPPLLRQERLRAQPRRVGAARRHRQEPDRPRPDQRP